MKVKPLSCESCLRADLRDSKKVGGLHRNVYCEVLGWIGVAKELRTCPEACYEPGTDENNA